jgi:hypothetical protein
MTKEKVVFWVLEELVLRAAENFLILKDPPWDLGIIIPLSRLQTTLIDDNKPWKREREGGIEIDRQTDRQGKY